MDCRTMRCSELRLKGVVDAAQVMVGEAVAHLAPTPEPKGTGKSVLVRENRTPASLRERLGN
jgi:hypothetical protein